MQDAHGRREGVRVGQQGEVEHLKKVNHLVEKYGRKSKNGWDGLLKEVKEIMGNPEPRRLQARHDEGGEGK